MNVTLLRRAALSVIALATVAGATSVIPASADPGGCVSGYVPRDARDGDTVCVTLNTQTRTAQENADPGANKQPGGGAYGPDTCASGFVWREAFSGDTICVLPVERTETKADNAAAGSRQATSQSQQQGPAQPSSVTFEIYSNDPGVDVAEIDIDTLGVKLGDTQLPFSRTDSIRSPTKLRLRAYGNGQHQIGCRITIDGQQVMDHLSGPVALCDWQA